MLSVAERITAKIVVNAETGCWEWAGLRSDQGYGLLMFNGQRRSRAHRVSFIVFRGPIPDGLQLDHLCHSRDRSCPGGVTCVHRRCVNPAHLDPVTNRENTVRGVGPKLVHARYAARTHCVNGHELNAQNVRHAANGVRVCRTCQRVHSREYSGGVTGKAPTGPLRRVIAVRGRMFDLECGHTVARSHGKKTVRARCGGCDPAPQRPA